MSGSSCEMTYASQMQQIWFFGVLSMSSHQTTLKLRRTLLPASGENILPAWSSQKMNHCLEGRQTHYTVIDAQLENQSCRFFPTGMIHCLERTTERSRLYERKVFSTTVLFKIHRMTTFAWACRQLKIEVHYHLVNLRYANIYLQSKAFTLTHLFLHVLEVLIITTGRQQIFLPTSTLSWRRVWLVKSRMPGYMPTSSLQRS